MPTLVVMKSTQIESFFTKLVGPPSAVEKKGEREYLFIYRSGTEGYNAPASVFLELKKEGSHPRFAFHELSTTAERRRVWVEQLS